MSQDDYSADQDANIVAGPIDDCGLTSLNHSEDFQPGPKMPVVTVCLALKGLLCMVETVDEDGEITSSALESTLKSLGAETTNRFEDRLSCYIISSQSIKTSFSIQKKHLAAELLDIPVVSPAWVDQCKETGNKVDMESYLVKGLLRAVPNDWECTCFMRESKGTVESVTEPENAAIAISTADTETQIAPNTVLPSPSPSPSPRPQQPALARRSSSAASLAAVPGLPRAQSVDSVPQAAVIMLPTFREISPPVVPAEVLEKVQKRRRSERICDLQEEDSDDELFSSAKRGKGAAEHESWEAVSRISALQPLPVFYEPGQEGDQLLITPIVLDGGARCSSKGGNSSNRRAASGIKGLTVKGKRDHSAGSGGKTTKSSHSSASVGGTGGSGHKSNSGKVGSKAGKTASKSAPSGGRACDPEEYQDEVEPASQAAAPSVPKTTVVIALTGFDDKSGDRAALVQTLRQFIKRDKLPIAEKSAQEAPTELDAASAVAGTEEEVTAMVVDAADGDNTADTGADASEAREVSALTATVEGEERGEVNPDEAMAVVDEDAAATVAADSNSETGIGILEERLADSDELPSEANDGTTMDAEQPLPVPVTVAEPVDQSVAGSVEEAVAVSALASAEDGTSAAPIGSLPAAPSAETTPVKRGRGRPPGSTKKHSAGSSSKSTSSSSSSSSSNASISAGITRGATRGINSSGGGNPSNDNSSNDEGPGLLHNSRWRVDPTEDSVSLTFEHNDFSAASCTHVVVSAKLKQPRTLRTAFARVRGQCILTEEWVHESVRLGAWADVGPYLHPRFPQQLAAGASEGAEGSKGVLRGHKICVLDSVNPPTEVLIDLVRAAGGKVTVSPGEPGIDFVLFGDVCAANDWTETKLKRHKSETHRQVADARALARANKAVTCQFLFHCIEEGRVRAPQLDLDELVAIEHMMVFTCSEKNYEDTVQAVAKAGERQPLSYDAAAREVNRARSAQREANPSREYWVPSESRPDSGKSGKADRRGAGGTSSNKHHAAGSSCSARVKQEPQPVHESAVPVRVSARRSTAQGGLAAALTTDSAQDPTTTAALAAAGHGSVPESHAVGLGTVRSALRRNPAGEEGRAVAPAPAPVKAERKASKLSKAAAQNKHALRDGKGKFKPLRQLRAEAAARAAAQAAQVPQAAEVEVETGAGEGTGAVMEVAEDQGGPEVREGDATDRNGDEDMVVKESAPEQLPAQAVDKDDVGAVQTADAGRSPVHLEVEAVAQDIEALSADGDDDDQSTGEHSLSPAGPEQQLSQQGEAEGEGDTLLETSAGGIYTGLPSHGTFPTARWEDSLPVVAAASGPGPVMERESPQSELLTGCQPLADHVWTTVSDAVHTGEVATCSRMGHSPKKRKYGFVDTIASAALQEPLLYQHHPAGAGTSAGAEGPGSATPSLTPSNYLAAVTEEESPELYDCGVGAVPGIQGGTFTRLLPPPPLILVPQVEDAGRVLRAVSDASWVVAQDSYVVPVPVSSGEGAPLPPGAEDVAGKEDCLAPVEVDNRTYAEGQQPSVLQLPPRLEPSEDGPHTS